MKFRDRLQQYRKAPPFPRPRGMAYNLPDALSTRTFPGTGVAGETYNPTSITVASYNGKTVAISVDQKTGMLIPDQRVHPLAMESNAGLYTPFTREAFLTGIHFVPFAIDDEGSSTDTANLLMFDGNEFTDAFRKRHGAEFGYRESISPSRFAVNKENSYFLFWGINFPWGNQTIYLFRYGDPNPVLIPEIDDGQSWYSVVYTGNGLLGTLTVPAQVISYVENKFEFEEEVGIGTIFIKRSDSEPMLAFNIIGPLFMDGQSTNTTPSAGSFDAGITQGDPDIDLGKVEIFNTVSQYTKYVNASGATYNMMVNSDDFVINFSRVGTGVYNESIATSNVKYDDNIPDFIIYKAATAVDGVIFDATDQAPYPGWFWTKEHPDFDVSMLDNQANQSGILIGTSGLDADNVDLGAEGYGRVRVSDHNYANKLNHKYTYWVAPPSWFRGIAYEVGSYVGNGSTQTIPLPFNDNQANFDGNRKMAWVLVKGDNNGYPRWKWESHPGAESCTFEAQPNITNGITSMSLDNFTVGNSNDVNENGVTYQYIAMTSAINSLLTFNDERQGMGYNYEDHMLYFWSWSSEWRDDSWNASLLRINHELNRIEYVTSVSAAGGTAAQSDGSYTVYELDPFFDHKMVFHPKNNRMFWSQVEGSYLSTWDSINGIQKAWEPELTTPTSPSGRTFDSGDFSQANDLIVFNDCVYWMMPTDSFGSMCIFKNESGEPHDWVVEHEIILTDYLPEEDMFGPRFGTLWPEGASEPTELYLSIPQFAAEPLGHNPSNANMSISGYYFLIFKKTVNDPWEFDAIITPDGTSTQTVDVMPPSQHYVDRNISGNGATRTFDIQCEPKVIVWMNTNNVSIVPQFWTDAMPANTTSRFIGSGETTGLITNVTANGGNSTFTISSNSAINQSGRTYYYFALPEVIRGQRRVACGEYGGDGLDNKEIEVPFEPGLVWIKSRQDSNSGWWKSLAMDDGYSVPFSEGAQATDHIKSLNVASAFKKGFTLGTSSDVNDPTKTYWWVAFDRELSVNLAWTGNDSQVYGRFFPTNGKSTSEMCFNKPAIDQATGNPTVVTFDLASKQCDMNTGNYPPPAPWTRVIPTHSICGIFIPGMTNTTSINPSSKPYNVGGIRYYWSGLAASGVGDIGNDNFNQYLFSVHGRMCLFANGQSTAYLPFRGGPFTSSNFNNFYIISKSPDTGSWGISTMMMHPGNNSFSPQPITHLDGTGYLYTTHPGNENGDATSTVVGPLRDNNKQ